VWDSKIRDYKYTESAEEKKDEFDSVFTVRRRFGWDNKYLETHVDIKSKVLRGALQAVFKDCKSISLVEDKPSVSVEQNVQLLRGVLTENRFNQTYSSITTTRSKHTSRRRLSPN
jgi:hypothetical protein